MNKRTIVQIQRFLTSVLVFVLIGAGVPQPAVAKAPKAAPTLLALASVQQAVAVAPAPHGLPKISPKPRLVKRTVWVTVTAYSSTVDQCDGDPFTTASGEKVHDGVVAWNAAPFGTELRMPSHFGDKIFVVKDRLNARASAYHIDVWMPTRAEAIQWGARVVRVEVLK